MTGWRYYHLDRPRLRERMVQLWSEEDAGFRVGGVRPYGALLTTSGWINYLEAMPIALEQRDDGWLFQVMQRSIYWRSRGLRRGSAYRVNIVAAAAALVGYEFNAAFVRGVARLAGDEGIESGVVYRAARAVVARTCCRRLEGRHVSLFSIAAGHRAYVYGPRPGAISIPAGVNCHHTIRIPEWDRFASVEEPDLDVNYEEARVLRA